MSHNLYQDLNIQPGASIEEIKAAFRSLAKAYHPDSAGQSNSDVAKFIKAQSAYQKLLAQSLKSNETVSAKKEETKQQWAFEKEEIIGLDVYYHIRMVKPQGSTKITLPWQAQEACPRCLGQGQTLSRVGQNSLYRPCTCSKCQGSGISQRASHLEVVINSDMNSKIRLRKAGQYLPKKALRGDLILVINWVDKLPSHN